MGITDIVAAAVVANAPTTPPTSGPVPGQAPTLPDPFAHLPLPWPMLIGLGAAAAVTIGMVGRLLYRALIPAPGYATAWDIRKEMSAASARAALGQTRPSLATQHGAWSRRRLPVGQYSYPIGRALSPWMWIRGTAQDSAAVIGPPGSSKTVWLTNVIVDAPGAVVHTSSKVDDHMRTWDYRAQVGPVYRFNPQRLGGLPSTVRINPVLGCRNFDTAHSRAGLLLYGARTGGDSNTSDDYFQSNAAEVLAAFLHAADLSGRTLVDVHKWANNPKDTEALQLLDQHGARPSIINVLKSRQTITDRTRDGIFSSLATALSWLSSEDAAWCVSPPPGEELDLWQFLLDGATLYLIAEDQPGTSVAPLFTLFVTQIIEAAIQLADQLPGRRLDPWLTLALDEIATICPLPLDTWIAKVRSHGILPIIALQSLGQLEQRWGRHGAHVIESVLSYTLVLRGIKSPEDLRGLSELCGEREVLRKTTQRGPNGPVHSEHHELRPVLPPHKIRQIRRGRMLVLYRGAPPVMVRISKPWKRRDLRRRDRAIQRTAATATAISQQQVQADGGRGRVFADQREGGK